jgi:Putative prokaryotic signal transducing protein
MTEVYSDPDLTQLAHCESILKQAGIDCVIKNEETHDLIAGLADPLRSPVLCVIDDGDAERAKELLRDVEKAGESNAPDWQCPKCSEMVPGNFSTCWKCEAPKPGA